MVLYFSIRWRERSYSQPRFYRKKNDPGTNRTSKITNHRVEVIKIKYPTYKLENSNKIAMYWYFSLQNEQKSVDKEKYPIKDYISPLGSIL